MTRHYHHWLPTRDFQEIWASIEAPSQLCCHQVQDMMDPEYYVGAFRQPGKPWQTTKYSDSTPETVAPDAETVVWDRKPLYCSRVPGEAAWVSLAATACAPSPPTPGRAPPDSDPRDFVDTGGIK
jgi:hypothetical protein